MKENEGFHFQSFDGCSTRNLVEITSKPTKTGAGYYTTKQTEMHLLMLGTKLVLFWADTSEKLEKLKESSEGDFVASLLRVAVHLDRAILNSS